MIHAEQINLDDKQRWNKLLLQSLYPSYRQSIEYENSKEINNRKVTSFIFTENGEDIGGAHYSIKYSRLLKTADILSGFVFKYEPSKELVKYIIAHFTKFAKKNNAAYIRISPWLPQIIKNDETEYKALFNTIFKEKQFDTLNEGRHTYWIDLMKNKDCIFSNFDKQTRNKIRKGIKNGLYYEIVNKYNNYDFEIFWNMYKNLGQKKGFHVLSKKKMKIIFKSLFDDNIAFFFYVKYKNEIISANLLSAMKISARLYSAINTKFKELEGCPSPGQYGYWVSIKELKNKGLKYYDVGFCPGAIPIEGHPQYNVWRFKYGFGGDHVQFLPTYGKAIKPLRGRIFKFIKYKK